MNENINIIGYKYKNSIVEDIASSQLVISHAGMIVGLDTKVNIFNLKHTKINKVPEAV